VKRLLLLAVPAVATLLSLWMWWQAGRPVALADAPAGKLDCASYTPPHEQPLQLSSAIDRSQIERDLKSLSTRFRCVRIYAVSNGIDAVPPVAREVGLRVLLGLWIGIDPALNQKEIEHGLEVARRDHDVIDAVIVGNEVLLRREQTPDRLATLIRQVKAGTDLPVTYADVWDFWKQNPELAKEVDFVTIHLLPYWDDRPTGIDAALAHTASVYGEARATFPDKRVFIGETGWPSQGRQRMDAVPGRVAQARFIREFTHWAGHEGIAYNLIEAYDQPWKRLQEGTVGGYWGMYDAGGRPKFPLQGPVEEDPSWIQGYWGAAVGAALFALAGLLLARRHGRPDLLLLLVAGAAAGAIAVMQWRYLDTTNRTTGEWLGSGMAALAGHALYAWILLLFAGKDARQALPQPAGIYEALESFNHRAFTLRPPEGSRHRTLGLLRVVVLAGLAYVGMGLALDPRYRGFPTCLYLLPVLALLLLALLGRGSRRLPLRGMPEETLLAGLAGACALVSVAREGWLNSSALGFAALCVVCAAVLLWPGDRRSDQHQ
jgi:exo-beta-1,3-glucanase (GH17 family)